MEIITQNAQQTKQAAYFLAKEIRKSKKTLVIGLEGELGSGKTTFIQGLADGLGVKEAVTSPTFVIMKKYLGYFYHFDCYRLDSPEDLLDLGWREIINQPGNLIVLEWAEKVKKIMPPESLWMKFSYLDQNKRKILIQWKD